MTTPPGAMACPSQFLWSDEPGLSGHPLRRGRHGWPDRNVSVAGPLARADAKPDARRRPGGGAARPGSCRPVRHTAALNGSGAKSADSGGARSRRPPLACSRHGQRLAARKDACGPAGGAGRLRPAGERNRRRGCRGRGRRGRGRPGGRRPAGASRRRTRLLSGRACAAA